MLGGKIITKEHGKIVIVDYCITGKFDINCSMEAKILKSIQINGYQW